MVTRQKPLLLCKNLLIVPFAILPLLTAIRHFRPSETIHASCNYSTAPLNSTIHICNQVAVNLSTRLISGFGVPDTEKFLIVQSTIQAPMNNAICVFHNFPEIGRQICL